MTNSIEIPEKNQSTTPFIITSNGVPAVTNIADGKFSGHHDLYRVEY